MTRCDLCIGQNELLLRLFYLHPRRYTAMLKMLKRYELHYHRTASEDADVVAGTALTFSSSPGAIHSQDDLYHVTGGGSHVLLVVGSAMKVAGRARPKVHARDQVTWEHNATAHRNRFPKQLEFIAPWNILVKG